MAQCRPAHLETHRGAPMILDAVWHDLECGAYEEDLPLWRMLAAEAAGPVLDVGAGTGRVSLDLAARGVAVVALDVNASLLDALALRTAGLSVETVVADARGFALRRRFALVLVPMQTLQLLGGHAGRAAFLRCARDHLEPGGLLAAAVADAMDCFDDERDMPPPPDVGEIAGVRYASQLHAVMDDDGRAAIHRRREVTSADGRNETTEAIVRLDRITADEVAAEAARIGFMIEPQLSIPGTDEYLGSTVVVLRAPACPLPATRGIRTHVGQRRWRQEDAAAYPPEQYEPPPPSTGGENLIEQLKQLAELRDQGILTEEGFATQKARLLA